jgi:hypothetical protein
MNKRPTLEQTVSDQRQVIKYLYSYYEIGTGFAFFTGIFAVAFAFRKYIGTLFLMAEVVCGAAFVIFSLIVLIKTFTLQRKKIIHDYIRDLDSRGHW